MKRRLLSMFMMLSLCGLAFAQQTTAKAEFKGGKAPLVAYKAKAPQRTAAIKAGNGQIWWSNYDTGNVSWNIDGFGQAGHYDVATFIPYDFLGGEGTTVDGFSFFALVSDMANVKVWVATQLPADGASADLEVVDVAASNLTIEDFNDVAFKKKHVIPPTGLYVGYSFDENNLAKGGQYAGAPLIFTNTENNRADAYLVTTGTPGEWENAKGNLLAKVLFGGGNFKHNAVSVRNFESVYTLKGKTSQAIVTVTNRGQDAVKSISYTVGGEGQSAAEKTVSISLDDVGTGGMFALELPAESALGIFNKQLTITKVNGKANESSTGVMAEGQLLVVSKSSPATPVVEEFTGTWCGWCPIGIVYMDKLAKEYGDKVVPVAVHDGDEMTIDAYEDVLALLANSYPSASVNRMTIVYPTVLSSAVSDAAQEVTPVELTLNASWTDDSHTAVRFDTQSTFNFDTTDGHYALAYLLTEDGMSDASWLQNNNFSGQSVGDDNMDYWVSAPKRVSGVKFNHVAVAGWDLMLGVEGSLPQTITDGKAIDSSFDGDISDNTLIQDKTKLTAVAMVVDTHSARILNAAKAKIGLPNGISVAETRVAKPAVRYNLSGQRVDNSFRGVVIENGRKLIVK